MEPTHGKNDLSNKAKRVASAAAGGARSEAAHEMALQERVDRVRDLVDDIRDRAEIVFHERPYLLPVATGALGLGIGVLIGSKLSRLLLFAAAGAMLSDQLRGQLVHVSRKLLKDLSENLEDIEDAEDIDDLETPAT
jgi:hypothetical protein